MPTKTELEWEEARLIFRNMPQGVQTVMRNEALDYLNDGLPDGHGIGSSDIACQTIPRIMRGNFSEDTNHHEIISLFVDKSARELKIELPYELKLPY